MKMDWESESAEKPSRLPWPLGSLSTWLSRSEWAKALVGVPLGMALAMAGLWLMPKLLRLWMGSGSQ